MATTGLDKMYYAKISEDENGNESYSAPVKLAKAISAELSVELAEAILYADDSVAETVKEFKSGSLTLGIDDIGPEAAAALLGVTVDKNGVVVSTTEDISNEVAILFRAAKANGKYRYFVFYRVKFAIPSTSLATKNDSITFNTPSIVGTIMRRNKADSKGRHPWKAEVTEGDNSVSDTVINGWYEDVYEPDYTATQSNSQQSGS